MPFDPVVSANIVWLGVSIVTVGLVFQYIFLPTLVDGFRDRLFSLRRELFLLVVRGEIKPDHSAYRHLRSDLNQFIRFAERMTFTRSVVVPAAALLMASDRIKDEVRAHHQEAIGTNLPSPLCEKFRAIDARMATAIAVHVLASSPLAWVLLLFAAPIVMVAAFFAGSKDVRDRVVTQVSDGAKCEVELLTAAA